MHHFIRNTVAFVARATILQKRRIDKFRGTTFFHNLSPPTTPLFDTSSAPESPYTEFAQGKLGILKPTFRRSVLMAAYRWLSGNGLTADEQQAMVDVWKAELDNKDFVDNSVDDAIAKWVEKRREVQSKEEKPPAIY